MDIVIKRLPIKLIIFVAGMALFLRNVTFHGILLDALFEEGNSDWGTVAALLSEGIAEGAVQPLKTTVFDRDDVEEAFRFMAQGKHIGKVLIKVCWLGCVSVGWGSPQVTGVLLIRLGCSSMDWGAPQLAGALLSWLECFFFGCGAPHLIGMLLSWPGSRLHFTTDHVRVPTLM